MSLEGPIYSVVVGLAKKVGSIVEAIAAPSADYHECDGSFLSKSSYHALDTLLAGRFDVGVPDISSTITLPNSFRITNIHPCVTDNLLILQATKTATAVTFTSNFVIDTQTNSIVSSTAPVGSDACATRLKIDSYYLSYGSGGISSSTTPTSYGSV